MHALTPLVKSHQRHHQGMVEAKEKVVEMKGAWSKALSHVVGRSKVEKDREKASPEWKTMRKVWSQA